MQSELKTKYQELFKKFGIDEKTGCLNNTPNIKFPTFPYIGSKYGLSKKILIVGLDIGSDEKVGGIQSFEERRKAIEDKLVSKHNPHIAGTYFTALFFLKDNLNLQNYWNKLKNCPTCQRALQNQEELPDVNLLSYIALTNYYKFVSVNRKNKTGGENRIHLNQEEENTLLIDEIKALNSDIIIFQSKNFKNKHYDLLLKIKDLGKRVIVIYHPSIRGKLIKLREPERYLETAEFI